MALIRPLLLFYLFLVARARSFFRKYKKKKTSFEIDQAAARPRPVTPAPPLASCMTRRLKTAKPTRIKGEPLSGGGMDDEKVKGSFFKLQSSWDGAAKLKKMAFAIRWCVLEFFKPSTFASTLELHKGGADRRPLWLCTVRCFVGKYEGKYGDGARHKVESTRVLLCCPCFGNCHGWRPCRGERLGEDAGKDTCLQSNEYFCDAVCGDALQGKRPLQKCTDVYQEQENFWRDWKLHNNIIDLLSSDKVGFQTDGSGMSADYWTRNGATSR